MKVIQQIKFNRRINQSGIISVFAITLLALACFYPLGKSEQTTEAATGTAQGSSLTLDITSGTASVDLNVTSPDGTFASSDDTSNPNNSNAAFSVTTNNFSGYTLSIMGNNDGSLKDESGNNTLTSITSAITEEAFSAVGGTTYNGMWGYKPSKLNSNVNTNYLKAPTASGEILDVTTTKNDTANNYTIAIGARTDYTTPSATYNNTFTIIAVTNPVKYTITYDANTTETVSNMPGTQNSSTSETSILLSDKTPIRAGYVFNGWCTAVPTLANGIANCSGVTYKPSGTYGIDKTTENITVLYAIWAYKNVGYIQDYTWNSCKTDATNYPVVATDKRDNNTYTLRFINDNCWMTQNLRLSVQTGTKLLSTTTNIASDYTYGNVLDLENLDVNIANSYTEARIHNSSNVSVGNWYNYCATTAGTICAELSSPVATMEAIYDICPKGWRLPASVEQDTLVNQVAAFSPVPGGHYFDGAIHSVGQYGDWWSSTASNNWAANRYGLYYDNNTRALSVDDVYDGRERGYFVRCVKSEVGRFSINYNSNGGNGFMLSQSIKAGTSATLSANTFTREGYDFIGWNTQANGGGTSYAPGATFTAPASENNTSITLYAQWKEKVKTMQAYTNATCASEANGKNVTVVDSRDSKSYTVQYINGACWMTQNLRFIPTSGMSLTTATTDVTSNRTMPTVGSLTSGNSYTAAYLVDSGNTSTGVWYNYCAASAGTDCQTSTTIAEANAQSICPAGWKLPTNSQFSAIRSYSSAFSPIYGGNYSHGTLSNSTTGGRWWSRTPYDTNNQYYLYYNSGRLNTSNSNKYYGFYVRCVRST